jgi:hypothetical protein
MLKLKITRYETNDRYEAELAEYQDRSRYGNVRMDSSDYPQKEIPRGVLEVFINESQFDAIRKATLEVF